MALEIVHKEPCPFCQYLRGSQPCAFVARGERASAFVNPTQYERGAVLVVPNDHVASILDATPEDVAAVATLAQAVGQALDIAFSPTGLNVFQNNGLASGQHVPHYHVHVVPRYESSEPRELFQARNFPFLSVEELEPTTLAIRQALSSIEAGAA